MTLIPAKRPFFDPFFVPFEEPEGEVLSIKVLSELYNDPSCTLLVVDTFDGYALQTNKKSFKDNNNPRERANLEYTLNQLLECNFISARGTAGTVFGITKEGYNFIVSLK